MTDILDTPKTRIAARGGALPRKRPCAGILARISRWRSKRRTRRCLADLEPWMLRDIGVTRAEAMREVRVSFPWHLSFPWRDNAGPLEPWC